MNPTRIVLATYADEGIDIGFAVVSMTDALVEHILNRRELFQMVRAKDSELSSLRLWDAGVEFYAYLDDARTSVENWAVLPDTVKLPDASSTEMELMCVYEDRVGWCAVPKHCDNCLVTTATIKYEQLLKMRESNASG